MNKKDLLEYTTKVAELSARFATGKVTALEHDDQMMKLFNDFITKHGKRRFFGLFG